MRRKGADTVGKEEGTYTARLKRADRPFLEAEAYRLAREAFARDGRLVKPSVGEVVSELLTELQELRDEVEGLRDELDGADDGERSSASE